MARMIMNQEEMEKVCGGELDEQTRKFLCMMLNENEKKDYQESGYSDLWLLANLKEQVGEGRMPEKWVAWAEKQLIDILGMPAD